MLLLTATFWSSFTISRPYIIFGSPASRGKKCQDFFSPTWTLYIPQNVSLITILSFLIYFLSLLYCLHTKSTCSVGSCSWPYSHNPVGCALFKLFCVEFACLPCVSVGSFQEVASYTPNTLIWENVPWDVVMLHWILFIIMLLKSDIQEKNWIQYMNQHYGCFHEWASRPWCCLQECILIQSWMLTASQRLLTGFFFFNKKTLFN